MILRTRLAALAGSRLITRAIVGSQLTDHGSRLTLLGSCHMVFSAHGSQLTDHAFSYLLVLESFLPEAPGCLVHVVTPEKCCLCVDHSEFCLLPV